jgi:hypothetical protein
LKKSVKAERNPAGKSGINKGESTMTTHELINLLPPKDRARIDRIDKHGTIILKYAGDQERISTLLERAAGQPLYGVFYGSVTDAVPFTQYSADGLPPLIPAQPCEFCHDKTNQTFRDNTTGRQGYGHSSCVEAHSRGRGHLEKLR